MDYAPDVNGVNREKYGIFFAVLYLNPKNPYRLCH